jgi:hypothetical protein
LGCADERLTELVVLDLLGDVHRAVTAVEFIVEAFVVLGLAEERQDLVVAPPFVPLGEIGFCSTKPDSIAHR